MKYNLRSLMIVVTLVCVVLGSRREYFRRCAAFHEREAEWNYRQLGEEFDVSKREVDAIVNLFGYGKRTPFEETFEIRGHRFKFRVDSRLFNYRNQPAYAWPLSPKRGEGRVYFSLFFFTS